MRPRLCLASLLMLLLHLTCGTLPDARAEGPRLSRASLEDKIRGGWAGQMIGVAYGAPTEFRSNARIFAGELTWSPDRVDNAIHQDDLYVEMTMAAVMQRLGPKASCEEFGEALKDSTYHLWHANAGARRALNQGIKAPDSGHPQHNIHANDIDFQIEADFIGLMCPAMPQVSNEMCDRVGRVMNYGDGLYGGMFVCGCYAAAFVENDPRRVVEAGLACIPPQSSYAMLIRDLLDWSARFPDDWRKVWQMVEDKWDKDDPCPDGALADFNIDAKLNGAYIALGLLFGEGDWLKTLEISTRCGQDSDCNPSSAAGVLGVMLGYSQIPPEFTSGIPKIADTKFEYTDYSFDTICQFTLDGALALIATHGGEVTDHEVVLPNQKPKAPPLEQWDPGVPDRRVGVQEPAWSWSGRWQEQQGAMVARGAGGEATLKFTGVAVVIVGRLNQEGGRADVFLDGQHVGSADAFIVANTHDNAFWHTYGLKPGEHTVRIVPTGQADPRSRGSVVAIERAVVYRAR